LDAYQQADWVEFRESEDKDHRNHRPESITTNEAFTLWMS